MQTVCQSLGVGIVLLVKLHRVPAILAPVLPVLDNHANRHLFLAEALGCLQDLVRGMEAFATMDIAQCPCRHGRALACQVAIGGNDLVGSADKHGIVDGIGNR